MNFTAESLTSSTFHVYESCEINIFFPQQRNGSTDGLFNVFTGEGDITRYTTINTFNHKKYLDFWKTEECNMINGTDGSSFPPGVTEDSVLYMFNENLCRSIPLTFWHSKETFGMKALR